MLRKIIKKFNNFRFTAIVSAIVSGVAALYALGSLFLYHFAHPYNEEIKVRDVGFIYLEKPMGAILGMLLFFFAVIALFISIYIAYSMVPFIKNQNKIAPRRGLMLAGFVAGIFELALVIFMILLIVLDNPQTKIGILIALPFGILSMIGQLLYLCLFLACDFFMPAVEQK